jgi:uncharacterized protein YndB with AHSA1/START domain
MSATATAAPSVIVQRHYDSPPPAVYAAWTRADMIVGWFGPSDAVPESVKAEMDVRTGGRFSISFTHGDGKEGRVSGLYKEVVPNEKLVFGWAWGTGSGHESQVTVTTKAEGRGTLLTLKHEQLFDQIAADEHRRGWNVALDKLAAVLARSTS